MTIPADHPRAHRKSCRKGEVDGSRKLHAAQFFQATLLAAALSLAGFVHAEVRPVTLSASPIEALMPKRAEFRGVSAPADVRHIADWAIDSRDNEGLPYIVVDKVNARVYVFDRHAKLIASAPVLLGLGAGDALPPGVADMEMNETRAWQRVTPAGRFRAESYQKPSGEWILWVDYDSAIALHKVRTNDPLERRQERLESPDPSYRRITYGCINVPAPFYDAVIHPTFGNSRGIVYVLPETRPAQSVFGSYRVPQREPASPAATPLPARSSPVPGPARHVYATDPLPVSSRSHTALPAVLTHARRFVERTLGRSLRVTLS
ncbi:MAG: L,D-transpeptidase [Burkholderiales bacterium]